MIDATFLALKIVYLIKQSGKNRFSMSEAKLKNLAQKEVLTIPYLQKLKYELEELGYFLGVLKNGSYGIFNISSLEGAPSLPIQQQTLDELSKLTEEELQEYCCTQSSKEIIAGSEKDEKMLQLEELWKLLIKEAKNKSTTTYGELAIKLTKEFGYKIHHKRVIELLKTINTFCENNSYPLLTYIAINATITKSNKLDIEQNSKTTFEKEANSVYSFTWDEKTALFSELLNKDKEN